MIDFLEKLPVNHWFSFALLFIGVACLIYVVYFYVSKEGRDERGRGIFAKASMLTFIITNLIFFYINTHLELFDVSLRGSAFIILVMHTVIASSQALGILLFKKLA